MEGMPAPYALHTMRTLDRFEGTYGAAYDAVLQRPALRRAFFRAVGSADPIVHLERVVEAIVAEVGDGTLLDVPCGGGTLLPLLDAAGFTGRAIALDLAAAMVTRAREVAGRVDGFEVEVVRGDALDLPLDDASVDGVASINGLHVLPDHARAVAEMARVVRPGGIACIVSITATRGLRNRAMRRIARAAHVLPRDVETRAELVALIEDTGFTLEHDFGGRTFTGLLARRLA
jgi:ubiquinone/menaquinone biosynthesis C-methylase UbiE